MKAFDLKHEENINNIHGKGFCDIRHHRLVTDLLTRQRSSIRAETKPKKNSERRVCRSLMMQPSSSPLIKFGITVERILDDQIDALVKAQVAEILNKYTAKELQDKAEESQNELLKGMQLLHNA